jgi:hypothetical protein
MKERLATTRFSGRWKILVGVCLATAFPSTMPAQFQLDIKQVADSAFPHVAEDDEPPQLGLVQIRGGIDIARNIDRWMFGKNRTEAKAREDFEKQLKLAIESIDRACKLTVGQKEKLRLAGAGDITLYFAEVDNIRAEFDGAAQHPNEVNRLLQRIQPLQQRMHSLFGPGSILKRVSDQVLEQSQRSRLEKAEAERLRFSFDAALKTMITKVERARPLSAAQREELMKLLKDAEGPKVHGRYMQHFVMYSLAKMQPQLRRILDKQQLAAMDSLFRQGLQMERMLKQQGYID